MIKSSNKHQTPLWLLRWQHGLTRVAGFLASRRLGLLTQVMIRLFIRYYHVNMQEAEKTNPALYLTFNDFFIRKLQAPLRPIEQAPWVCPVDGCISQVGKIEQGKMLQVKGHWYSVNALLAQDEKESTSLSGAFATFYLSPRDYHRIHMPCSGRLLRMTWVPGALYSVNAKTVERVPDLFARNERVITWWETSRGLLVIVLVGATIVSSMSVAWHGAVVGDNVQQIQTWNYDNQIIKLEQGEEMGYFQLGSTVIMLWPDESIYFLDAIQSQKSVKWGQSLAHHE